MVSWKRGEKTAKKSAANPEFYGELLRSGRLLWKRCVEGWVCLDDLAQSRIK